MVRRNPNQVAFRFPEARPALAGELIIDIFAGGGGASHGIEKALGRSPDYAINHDEAAITMHTANHPSTIHLREDIWKVKIRDLVASRPVGLLWASPDCRHFSRAKGGKPVSKSVRSLAWVVVEYAREVSPRVICLENVPEFLDWGPLDDQGAPIKERKGEEFTEWTEALRALGYAVEWKMLTGADFGAPTSRKRLFLVARNDGRPIAWPERTHGKGTPYAYRTAAECIDWSIPCPSIFRRKRNLALATLRRVARGIVRYVIEDANPFLVQVNHSGNAFRGQRVDSTFPTVTKKHGFGIVAPHLSKFNGIKGKETRAARADGPLPTQTSEKKFGLAAATLVQTGYGERAGQRPRYLNIRKPLGTTPRTGKHAACYCILKHFGGVVGLPIEKPLGTITKVDHHSLCEAKLGAPHLTKLYGTATGADLRKGMPTSTSGGQHLGLVSPVMVHYYSQGGQSQRMGEPMHAITTKHRHALAQVALSDDLAGGIRVARFMMKYGNYIPPTYVRVGRRMRAVILVRIGEAYYLLTDIGLRMLQPRELATAQGFPPEYQLTGTKSEQVAKIGNSVVPQVAAAVVAANLVEETHYAEAAIA